MGRQEFPSLTVSHHTELSSLCLSDDKTIPGFDRDLLYLQKNLFDIFPFIIDLFILIFEELSSLICP
jgi:hypothetical protein